MPYTDHTGGEGAWENPYSTVKKWAKRAKKKQDYLEDPAAARTWITGYDTPYWAPTVNYGEKEIRIMCPADAEFAKQTVGAGGDANSYYVTFKTYAPDDSVVGYIEHLGDKVDDEILTSFSTDKYGRRYQPTWLAVAKYDETTDTWSYYGANSIEGKYIGWDYQIDWYNADGLMVASDSIRINLSNEDCHNNIKPYYVANYATTEEVKAIKETVTDIGQSYVWGEM
jgi:hypothetical protein